MVPATFPSHPADSTMQSYHFQEGMPVSTTIKPMRPWRRLCAVIVGLAITQGGLMGSSLFASPQEDKGVKNQVEQTLARMTTELNLTAEQQDQIRPILQEQADSLKALKKQSKEEGEAADPAATKKRRQEIKKTTQEKLQGILSAEQMEGYLSMQTVRRDGKGADKDD